MDDMAGIFKSLKGYLLGNLFLQLLKKTAAVVYKVLFNSVFFSCLNTKSLIPQNSMSQLGVGTIYL